MGLFSKVAVPKIVAEDGIAIGEALEPAHQPKGIPGEFILIELPYDPQLFIQLLHPVPVAAGDQEVAVGQEHALMHVSWDGNFPKHDAVGVEFFDLVLALAAYEIVPGPRLAHPPELI